MRVRLVLAAVLALALTACGGPGFGSATNTVAFIPGYSPGASATPMPPSSPVAARGANVVTVALGQTDPQHMYIHMSSTTAPAGKVSFIVTNEDTRKHEFVVLATKTPAAEFPIVSFEGEANRIDEDAKGVVNVGETGDMEPGTTMVLTIDLPQGHYAVVCNLPGHYAAGMHQDFWATPA